jgi:hypothetical protein
VSAPLGPDNINVAWPFMKSAHANGNSSLADLSTQDQDTVVAAFKQKMLAPGSSVFTAPTGPLADVWAGLRRTPGVSIALSIIEAIVQQAFAIGDEFNNIGEALEAAATQFGEKWFGITSAQGSADYANAQLAVKNRPIVALFDEQAAFLGPPMWFPQDLNYASGDRGQPKTDGGGNCVFAAIGGARGDVFERYLPAQTATDRQVITAVMPSQVWESLFGGDSHMMLCGKVNDTGPLSDAVLGRIGYSGVGLSCLVGGVTTIFGTNPISTANGDTWDFYVGDAVTNDDDHYVIIRNGVPVLDMDASDGTGIITKGPGFRSVGFIMDAADRGFGSAQTPPGSLAVFSADDQ